MFRDAGFGDVRCKTITGQLQLASVSEALTMMQEAFGVYRAVVADLGSDERSRAWEEVRECLQQFETSDGFGATLEFHVVSGAHG